MPRQEEVEIPAHSFLNAPLRPTSNYMINLFIFYDGEVVLNYDRVVSGTTITIKDKHVAVAKAIKKVKL